MSIVIAVAQSLYPSEKFEKQMKLIIGLIFLLCIIKPIANGNINFFENEINAVQIQENVQKSNDGAMNYFCRTIENNLNKRLLYELNKNGILCGEVKTSINISDNDSISINEIEITLCNPEQEGDVIEIIKEQTGYDNVVKFNKEQNYDSQGTENKMQ